MNLEHRGSHFYAGDAGTKELLQSSEPSCDVLGQHALAVDKLNDTITVKIMSNHRAKHEVFNLGHTSDIVCLINVLNCLSAVKEGIEYSPLLFKRDCTESNTSWNAQHLLLGQDHLAAFHLESNFFLEALKLCLFRVNGLLTHFNYVLLHFTDLLLLGVHKVGLVGFEVLIFAVHYVVELVQVR